MMFMPKWLEYEQANRRYFGEEAESIARDFWAASRAEAFREAAEIARSSDLIIQREVEPGIFESDAPETATQEAVAKAIEAKK